MRKGIFVHHTSLVDNPAISAECRFGVIDNGREAAQADDAVVLQGEGASTQSFAGALSSRQLSLWTVNKKDTQLTAVKCGTLAIKRLRSQKAEAASSRRTVCPPRVIAETDGSSDG